MFGQVELQNGKNNICDKNFHANMNMDVATYLLEPSEKLELISDTKETAILPIFGKLTIRYLDKEELIERENCFENKPSCLHVPKGIIIEIVAHEASELLVQQKENDNTFPPRFYKPEDVSQFIAGEDDFEASSKRIIRTIFDYETAPYSNMVLGEVLSYTGRWNSYPPHHHPQPEVYYFKFDHPNGFGVSVIGDEAALVKNNSVAYIPGGLVHPQVCAPGYRMYYVWMIPHFENNPWTERIYAEEHKWLLEK
ncbi:MULTISPECIES: 5-deoxy-glucuronate isomerase [unclassified Gemella]|uniref:5-deoxy-glucuronate isomerase n=1 Tax=unclassified Gemella TaxID=2624949 RepID=UPI001C05BC08|nr:MULTISPECIES: 5-deoxy-glucuronate isomerase [unclassified Gemella]MBU0278239.1 5-deoxy-glucuronate isomerase [Gemella sp. zg-1178]QWQ38805.1 5-deoxy-glucuronate isomerase [Gemella sp. zg-570]